MLSYIKCEEIMLTTMSTLDGLGTFHRMGIIAALTPGIKQTRSVPRISATAEDVAAVGKIDITAHHQLQGSNMEVRCSLESHMAHPFTEAWVV